MSVQQDTESIIEDATFDFAMGDAGSAISKLKGALEGLSCEVVKPKLV